MLNERGTPRLAALLALLALAAAACGGDGGSTGATAEADGAGGPVTGTVDVSGSSTVEPISIAVAEAFAELEPAITVNVDGPGTGDGFELFCAGETAISDASRPIKAEEAEACADAGVEFIELKVAFDGISVLTSPDNGSVECLSFADLYALTGPESQGLTRWSDAEELAAELGSSTSLPDTKLAITAPGEESGTYDSFVEIVLEGIAEERGQEPVTRKDYQASADDNVIIQGLAGSPGSLGWVGFAFAEGAGDTVRELAVSAEPGGDCISPDASSIADGTYPIARPLFIYVNAGRADADPAVAAYVDFYLSDDGLAAVEDVGYVSLPAAQVDETRATWDGRRTGSEVTAGR